MPVRITLEGRPDNRRRHARCARQDPSTRAGRRASLPGGPLRTPAGYTTEVSCFGFCCWECIQPSITASDSQEVISA